MRDVTLFISRMNARITSKLKLEAAFHGVQLDGLEGIEEESQAPPLTEKQKEASARALKEAQERLKAGWAQTNLS